jgi:myo-inositol-1(or 4)-monophosphatase
VLTTGFSAEHEDISADLDLFGKLIKRTRGVRQLGSAALEACYVAAGRLDGYYRRGLSVWDVTAGSLIVEAAGGKVTNYQGDSLNLQDTEIVASNGFLHPSLVHGTSSDGS